MPRPRRYSGPGAPPRLNAVIDRDENGQPVTVRDRIIDWVRTGCPSDVAAAKAGVGRQAIVHWFREAAAITERQTINPYSRLTRHEQELIEFSQQVERARAEHEAGLWDRINGHANGGLEKRTQRVEDDGQGQVTKRVAIVETTLPSESAAIWLLKNQYDRMKPIELRVEQGTLSDSDRAGELATALKEFIADRRKALAAGVIETNGHVNGS